MFIKLTKVNGRPIVIRASSILAVSGIDLNMIRVSIEGGLSWEVTNTMEDIEDRLLRAFPFQLERGQDAV